MSSLPFRVIPVTPFQQNCTLIACPITGDMAVIDPGGDLSLVHAGIRAMGGKVVKLLLTHGHLDHVGAAAKLARELGVPIWGPHRDDAFWIDQLPAQSKMLGLPLAESFVPERWFEDGDQIAIGELQITLVHCPGHTPGHVVFFLPDYRWAQVGDVLFSGSIGRTDFPRGNHADLIRSIREKLFPLGDDVAFVPGHGPMSTFGDERRSNPFVSDRAVGLRG